MGLRTSGELAQTGPLLIGICGLAGSELEPGAPGKQTTCDRFFWRRLRVSSDAASWDADMLRTITSKATGTQNQLPWLVVCKISGHETRIQADRWFCRVHDPRVFE